MGFLDRLLGKKDVGPKEGVFEGSAGTIEPLDGVQEKPLETHANFDYGETFLSEDVSAGFPNGKYKMLFVCTGNICRSAAAAVTARYFDREDQENERPSWVVESAGTGAVVGHGLDADIRHALEVHGVEGLEKHIAKQVSFELLSKADIIIVFDESHFLWVASEVPEVISKIIPFRKMGQILSDGPRTLKEVLDISVSLPTRPEHWLEDPYRKGAEVAKAAVNVIVADLGVIKQNLR